LLLLRAGGQSTLGQAELVLMEFSPYLIRRMGGDARIIVEFFGSFPKVELASGEDSCRGVALTGTEAVERLTAFNRDYQDTPMGAYLDIAAWR
jgi:hypothetical protein